jgi:NAD dependent epimerase/dehydratase family enzyme
MRIPAFAARLLFGELADGLLLASQHAVPTVLTASGFEFAYPTLEDALRHLLGREWPRP